MKEELEIKEIDSKNKIIKFNDENSKNGTIINKETDSIKENKNIQKTENITNSNELKRNESESEIENKRSNTSHHSYKNKNCCERCACMCSYNFSHCYWFINPFNCS
jgi:hypothetical protein